MNISRQNLYLLALSVILLIIVMVFSFTVLIPNGKEYRIKRNELLQETRKLRQLNDFSIETEVILDKLTSDNRHIITAFDMKFDKVRFVKQHRKFFTSLKVSKMHKIDAKEEFDIYEVRASSEINSPTSFYKFLEAVNKSDWIIAVNFPIDFKRDAELIHSSFTMKVYSNPKNVKNNEKSNNTKQVL